MYGIFGLACRLGDAPPPPALTPSPPPAPVTEAQEEAAHAPSPAAQASSDIALFFLAMPGASAGRTAALETLGLTDGEAIDQGHTALAEIDLEKDELLVRSLGDGEGWTQQLKRYSAPDGTTVLLAVRSEWGMCGTQSMVKVWTVKEQDFVDVTHSHWPTLQWSDFHDGTPLREATGQAPQYGVHLTDEEHRPMLILDDCQLQYDELSFDAPPADWTRRERLVDWNAGRFTLSEALPQRE